MISPQATYERAQDWVDSINQKGGLLSTSSKGLMFSGWATTA